jgi:hypothetical protein
MVSTEMWHVVQPVRTRLNLARREKLMAGQISLDLMFQLAYCGAHALRVRDACRRLRSPDTKRRRAMPRALTDLSCTPHGRVRVLARIGFVIGPPSPIRCACCPAGRLLSSATCGPQQRAL